LVLYNCPQLLLPHPLFHLFQPHERIEWALYPLNAPKRMKTDFFADFSFSSLTEIEPTLLCPFFGLGLYSQVEELTT
jgi:hypothetical protein